MVQCRSLVLSKVGLRTPYVSWGADTHLCSNVTNIGSCRICHQWQYFEKNAYTVSEAYLGKHGRFPLLFFAFFAGGVVYTFRRFIVFPRNYESHIDDASRFPQHKNYYKHAYEYFGRTPLDLVTEGCYALRMNSFRKGICELVFLLRLLEDTRIAFWAYRVYVLDGVLRVANSSCFIFVNFVRSP